jgi:RecG-like helicase
MVESRAVSLDDPLETLPGAGPVTAARMAARGLACVRDLLFFFPEHTRTTAGSIRWASWASACSGTSVVVRGKIVRVHKFFRRMLDVHIEENGSQLARALVRPNAGMAKTFEKGASVALAGKLRVRQRRSRADPSRAT